MGVAFEDQLRASIIGATEGSLDRRVHNANLSNFKPSVYTDVGNTSYRLDGNNVDPDTENVYLAKNQLYYQGVLSGIDHEFNMMKTAMGKGK